MMMMMEELDHPPNESRDDPRVATFGWAKLGPKGVFMEVDKNLIDIDWRYQRKPSERQVQKIVEQFSWAGFGTASLATRPTGRFCAYDAGTRLRAADYRNDILTIPSMVFTFSTLKEEVEAFEFMNTRRAMSAIVKFNAAVHTGTPVAVITQELLDAHGKTAGTEKGQIRCIQQLLTAMKTDAACLKRLFPLMLQISGKTQLQARVVSTLMFIEHHAVGASLTDPRWAERVIALGSNGIIESCKKADLAYAKGGEKAWVFTVMGRLNKGVKDDKFKLDINLENISELQR